jgi:hypothetical protein
MTKMRQFRTILTAVTTIAFEHGPPFSTAYRTSTAYRAENQEFHNEKHFVFPRFVVADAALAEGAARILRRNIACP